MLQLKKASDKISHGSTIYLTIQPPVINAFSFKIKKFKGRYFQAIEILKALWNLK